jgi:hypothetical protein
MKRNVFKSRGKCNQHDCESEAHISTKIRRPVLHWKLATRLMYTTVKLRGFSS